MKCLVFGGNGFLGRHLCQTLLKSGYEVRVFDRPVRDIISRPAMQVEWYEGDFVNEEDVCEAMDGCEVVFHLISTTLPKNSNDNPAYDVESNVVGTIRMLSSAVRAGIKKVIFPSSGGTIYGVPKQIPISEDHPTDPICSYGITKLAIEKYLHLFHAAHGLDYSVLRIANPYGEGQRIQAAQGAIGVFIGKAIRHQPVEIWGDGTIIRDYIHVSDVSSAFVKAMEYSKAVRVFNIGSKEGRSLNDILEAIEDVIGAPIQRKYKSARNVDIPVNILDNSLAKAELNWDLSIKFEDGVARTVKHYLGQFQDDCVSS